MLAAVDETTDLAGARLSGSMRRAFIPEINDQLTEAAAQWAETNNAEAARWDDRTRPDAATQAEGGVALELMIAHANRTRTDPWFCVPHLADDAFVRRMAETVRDGLGPGREARVEYSNEVWNAGFEQAAYAMERGRAEIGGADPHALVQALAQTELAVQTAVAVRDKVVEAYQEILRMPV